MRGMVQLPATCEGCRALSLRSFLTHPTQAILFTLPPTDCFAIDFPGRALFPGGDGETHC
jgi:hypothetical protein